MTRRAALRAVVAKKQGLVVSGAFDGISARLVQDAGFPAVYMTGYGTAARLRAWSAISPSPANPRSGRPRRDAAVP